MVEKNDAVDFAIVGRQNVMNHGENRDLNREYRIVGGESIQARRAFLQMEGSPKLNTAEMQYALALSFSLFPSPE